MLSQKKKSVESFLTPLISGLSKVHPNILTLIGSIPPVLFFVAVLHHHFFWALIAFLGNLLDMLDGIVARKFNRVSAFGGFLDSTLDRMSDFFFITPFAFAGIVSWWIVMPFLLCSFMTSYMRSRGELANPKVSFAVGILERTERLIGIFFTLFLYMLLPSLTIGGLTIAEAGFLLLGILSAVTVIQRFLHAYKKL